MTQKRKRAAKRARPARAKKPARELTTILDFVRHAVSRFRAAKLVFAHGTTDPVAEAAFLVGEALHLPPERFDAFSRARVAGAGRTARLARPRGGRGAHRDSAAHRGARAQPQAGRLSGAAGLYPGRSLLCRRARDR